MFHNFKYFVKSVKNETILEILLEVTYTLVLITK